MAALCAATETRSPGWQEHTHNGREPARTFENYVLPRIGQRLVSEVTAADVLEIIEPIWHSKPTSARRLRQRIRAVLEWAVALEMPCVRRGRVRRGQS